MDARLLEPASWQGEWANGWKTVAVALVAYVLGAVGIFFAFGLFIKPLASEFHWSREAISGFTSIAGVTYAIASPFVGRLADTFGMRRVILICAVIVAVAYGSQSLLTGHLWHYYSIALVIGPAAAGTSALTFGKVISNLSLLHPHDRHHSRNVYIGRSVGLSAPEGAPYQLYPYAAP